MKLYLMRHAEAVLSAGWSGDDFNRPLSRGGRRALLEAAPAIARLSEPPKEVLTSPYDRARSTAQILSEHCRWPEPATEKTLRAGAAPNALKKLALHSKRQDPVIMVGHMPDLAIFAARVLSDLNLLEHGLKPGEIVALETDSLKEFWGNGKLLWRRNLQEWKTLR